MNWPHSVTPEALLKKAREAQQAAYVPYSHFPVGAALLTTEGAVILGCNVENASYGLSICAERNALTTAVALGERHFVAIAVVGRHGEPCLPCGACRQFMAEFNAAFFVVLEEGTESLLYRLDLDLLPHPFVLEGEFSLEG
ncbi:MAG: cytidine deaminase [Synergistales bacterium]|nr:cytidine deaminase [Synergistales bacterium]